MGPRIIAILNNKGGVGKTTTCFNLASAYADQGLRILAIDLDPQSHLAVSFGVTDSTVSGVDEIFLRHVEARSLIHPVQENLDLLPAGMRLGEVEKLAAKGRSQAEVVANAITPLRADYDLVLIDCPPNAGLLNFNALFACSEILIPVSGDYLSLHGLSRLLLTLKSAQRFMHKQLTWWIVMTRYTTRRRLSAQVSAKLEKYFPDQLLTSRIRENAPLAECPSFGKSIFKYSRRSNGAQDYAALADELLYRPASTP